MPSAWLRGLSSLHVDRAWGLVPIGQGAKNQFYDPILKAVPALLSSRGGCLHPCAAPKAGWGGETALGCAKQQGSGVGLVCTGWATLWGAAGKPPLDCAHLFGLAEVGNVQGVDATGMDACPAHLSTVLELLLLPR